MTPADRQRLARILGMLGSEHAGERASAALQAEAFRKRHAMTWEEMLALPPVEVVVEPVWTPPSPEPEPEPPIWTPPPLPIAPEWISISRPSMPIGKQICIALFWLFLFGQGLRPISYYFFGVDF